MTIANLIAACTLALGIGTVIGTVAYQIGQDKQKNEDYAQLSVIPDLKNELKKAQTDLINAQAASKKSEQLLESAHAALQSKNAHISALEKSRTAFNKCAVFVRGIENEDRKIMIGMPSAFVQTTKEDRDLYIAQAQQSREKLYSNLATANCAGN
jgi:hypothetical protein